MQRIVWWNVCNLFDAHDDPHTDDFIRDHYSYRRDIREITHILGGLDPLAQMIGLGELENYQVIEELIHELRWQKHHPDYRCPGYIDSKDPRGIDVGCLYHPNQDLKVDRVEALYPEDKEAVRPILLMHTRVGPHLLQIAFLHSKSRRSGNSHPLDSTPGSNIRFSYAHLLRQLANDAGAAGIGFMAMGDFNDEPQSPSLIHGAEAMLGRPAAADVQAHRLYNLSLEMAVDTAGTHCFYGLWAFLDQILVNGILLSEHGLRIIGRPHVLKHGPLLHKGEPNRWYSDHLPISICIGHTD